VFDIKWNKDILYGDVFLEPEREFSIFNFEESDPDILKGFFNNCEREGERLAKDRGLIFPAYDFCLKCSHIFNLLDARGAISVTERANYIGRVRNLAKMCAELYVKKREEMGFPLLKK
jgi:glycyl-tRNA synthetase alpha chain